MSTLAIVCARKGHRDKNLWQVGGLSMVGRALKAAEEADATVLTTDSPHIVEAVAGCRCDILLRDAKLSASGVALPVVVKDAVEWWVKENGTGAMSPAVTIAMQANVPLWRPGDLKAVLRRLDFGDCDAAGTAYYVEQRPEWVRKEVDGLAQTYGNVTAKYRRQDLPELVAFDGAAIAVRTEVLMDADGKNEGKGHLGWAGDTLAPVFRPWWCGVEVHDRDDLAVVEQLLPLVEVAE